MQAEYQKVSYLAAEQRRKQAEYQEKSRQAQTAKNAGLNRMGQAFQVVLIAPLTGLIAPLVVSIDPISAAATVAILGPQVDNILRNTESRMVSETDSYRREMEPRLNEMDRYAADAEQRSRDAEAARDKLIELARNQGQNGSKFSSTSPSANTATVVPANRTAVVAASAPIVLAAQAVNVSLIPKLRVDLQNTAAAARNVKTKTPPAGGSIDLSAYQNRSRTDLDRLFAGKAPAQAQQDTTQLLTEARKRYDAATVAKLEHYLHEQASARTSAGSPTKLVAVPANVTAATRIPPTAATAPSSPATTTQYVDCAARQVRVDVTTRLPEGWSHAPSDGALRGVHIQAVGNERALVCVYQAYDGQVALMRKLPPQARDCQVDQSGRRFVCQIAAR
jgi:hypothetical protein